MQSEATAPGIRHEQPFRATVPSWERRIVGWLGRNVWFRNRKGGPWPVPAHLAHEPVVFEGNTGARVRGRYFHLDAATERGARVLDEQDLGEPRGVVVCVHPDRRYGQHWFVKEGWVEWLTGHGFEVLTFDLPFYGETKGPAQYYPEDVAAAVAFARRWSGGLPVHLVGLSLGSFAIANASPHLENVESIVLESPYPTFTAWYGRRRGRFGSKLFEWAFPRTNRLIQAHEHIAEAKAKRILVAATRDDETTDVALSRRVAAAAPPERTEYLELEDVGHLGLFREEPYRQAVLRTLGVTSGPRPRATRHASSRSTQARAEPTVLASA